jgi:hypothetical protein
MGVYPIDCVMGLVLTDSRLFLKSRPLVYGAEVVLVSPLDSNGYARYQTIGGEVTDHGIVVHEFQRLGQGQQAPLPRRQC